MASAIKTAPKNSKLRKGILTLVAVGALGAVGAFASTALLSDDVSMSSSVADGGTLKIEPTASNTFALGDISNMQPGDERSARLDVTNSGSVPGKVTISTTGSATDGCYQFILEGNGGPIGYQNIMGAAYEDWGGNVAPGAHGPVEVMASGKSKAWAAGETHNVRLTLRMTKACTVGSDQSSQGSTDLAKRGTHASANLTVKLDIAQV